MQAVQLSVKKRDILGKKVKRLRREGLLPASVFGKDVKSVALSVPAKDFMKVYSKVGETGLVELKYDSTTQHTLVSNVQIHPLSRQPLHVEFHAVKLTEKIKADVPLELVGAEESPVIQNNIGLFLQPINEVEVEALPTDLPDKIAIDVSKFTNVDEQITISQLVSPKGVTILTPGDQVVVKVASAVSEETQKELEAEEAAKAAESATAEVPTESAPAEGSSPAPETPKEDK